MEELLLKLPGITETLISTVGMTQIEKQTESFNVQTTENVTTTRNVTENVTEKVVVVERKTEITSRVVFNPNYTVVTEPSFGCVVPGKKRWLLLIILAFVPLAVYVFWLPISIFLAKLLLKNKGPMRGRARRIMAQKAHDLVTSAVQAGASLGTASTHVLVRSNIVSSKTGQKEIFTLDAHRLDDPNDSSSGRPVTIDEMKAQLAKLTGWPVTDHTLKSNGTELKDGTRITDYDLLNNATV